MKHKDINKLKEDIEISRNNLNQILSNEKDKEKIIKFSQDLDLLIRDYYLLNKQRKVADM